MEEAPSNQEALQALADLYTRLNEPVRAAQYYALQFDRLVEAGDLAKASAIFSRFLRNAPQPAERLLRYAMLLQRQNRTGDAMEQYSAASDIFKEKGQKAEALTCYDKLCQLDPENAERYVVFAEMAEVLGQKERASRGYLRAGQLTQSAGALDQALSLFERGHKLVPSDRTGALLYAEARLRRGDAAGAVALLDPFSPNETDTMFLGLFGDALLQTGNLDRARSALEGYYRQKQDSFAKLFELASAYLSGGQDEKAVSVLTSVKEWMRGLRRENEFASQIERISGAFPNSLLLAEFTASLWEEMNREAKYFDSLVGLFDLYVENGRIQQACDVIDKLIDIDQYDYRIQDRVSKLDDKADPEYLRSLHARTGRTATATSRPDTAPVPSASHTGFADTTTQSQTQQTLDDLIVQVEIFLQYSLQSKAIERLEHVAAMFPGEEDKNERLRGLYERANWWPKGAPPAPPMPPTPVAATPAPTYTPVAPPPAPLPPPVAGYSVETHRDLSAITEITRLLYRQATPREVLSTAVHQIGKYLGVSRCIAAAGPPEELAQLTAEFAAPGLPALGPAGIMNGLGLLAQSLPDPLGGIELTASSVPELRGFGLQSAFGVYLSDKEAQERAGALLVGDANARPWPPNVSFFLQAVGDQLVLSANHSRLRSLVRSLSVTDEKTGLLSRGSYLDCLMSETTRARTQKTSLSLLILQLDHGAELLRQHGERPLERYVEQLARTLGSSVRQTDLAVKYTAWSLAFILPDTTVENAKLLAEKLRTIAASVPTTWNGPGVTLSAVVAEATDRPADDIEDRVTEWINRVDAGLDEIRQEGGNGLLALATP